VKWQYLPLRAPVHGRHVLKRPRQRTRAARPSGQRRRLASSARARSRGCGHDDASRHGRLRPPGACRCAAACTARASASRLPRARRVRSAALPASSRASASHAAAAAARDLKRRAVLQAATSTRTRAGSA
jgi:hypothetical protein